MEAVDRLFAAYFEQGVAPGMAFGVVVDGKLVHSGGMGTLRVGEQALPGKDSVFRIASMTKSFIAATILLLRDEGVLQLDDRAEKWVPELLGVPLPTGDSAPPTLRQLLSMNGGLPEDDPWARDNSVTPSPDREPARREDCWGLLRPLDLLEHAVACCSLFLLTCALLGDFIAFLRPTAWSTCLTAISQRCSRSRKPGAQPLAPGTSTATSAT